MFTEKSMDNPQRRMPVLPKSGSQYTPRKCQNHVPLAVEIPGNHYNINPYWVNDVNDPTWYVWIIRNVILSLVINYL